MNTRQIFKAFILPRLLAITRQLKILDNIMSISLYGSTNYEPCDKKFQLKNPVKERDYDIWIIFKRGCSAEARQLATELFGVNFKLLQNHSPCIIYSKIRLQTNIGEFLLAPMIVTEEAYELLQGNLTKSNENIIVHWYRPRARERPPKVPVCSTNFAWSEFDMQQEYISDVGLWRLMMPLIVHKNGLPALGTFIECALSGNCFCGDCQKDFKLQKRLFLETIRHLHLRKTFIEPDIPSGVYRMMTIGDKARASFKQNKIQQFSQWLSTWRKETLPSRKKSKRGILPSFTL